MQRINLEFLEISNMWQGINNWVVENTFSMSM